MKTEGIKNFKRIDEYIEYKLQLFKDGDKSFDRLCELMFLEKDNLFIEESQGLKIKQTTYGECLENIERLSKRLSFLLDDFQKNSIIALDEENSVCFIELLWAIIKSGHRVLLVNSRIDKEVLNKVFIENSVSAVVSRKEEYDVKTIKIEDVYSGEDFFECGECGGEIIVMSSGTTGNVKLCAYTAKQFFYQICDSVEIIKKNKKIKGHYEGYLKQLTFLPFYHIFGFVAVYLWFAFFSRSFVLLKDFSPKTIVNTAKRHKITHLFAVPLFWEKVYEQAQKTIAERGEKTVNKFNKAMKIRNKLLFNQSLCRAFSKIAFKEVRENIFGNQIQFLISGGSFIRKEVLEFFNAIGYHLVNGYGMSEVGIASVEFSNDLKVIQSASIGQPLSSIEFNINAEGELLVRGKTLADSITEGGVRHTLAEGEWFNTHDLCKKTDGNYYILGRKDDLIVSKSGENLNPEILEPLIKIDDAKNLSIVKVKSGEAGFIALVVEVNQFAQTQQLEQIKKQTYSELERLNLSAEIDKVILTKQSLIGENDFKINRKKIAKKIAMGELYDEASKAMGEQKNEKLYLVVRKCFAKALQKSEDEIFDNAHFFLDLGGSSLDYFTMLSLLKEEFGASELILPKTTFNTVEEICVYIENNYR